MSTTHNAPTGAPEPTPTERAVIARFGIYTPEILHELDFEATS